MMSTIQNRKNSKNRLSNLLSLLVVFVCVIGNTAPLSEEQMVEKWESLTSQFVEQTGFDVVECYTENNICINRLEELLTLAPSIRPLVEEFKKKTKQITRNEETTIQFSLDSTKSFVTEEELVLNVDETKTVALNLIRALLIVEPQVLEKTSQGIALTEQELERKVPPELSSRINFDAILE